MSLIKNVKCFKQVNKLKFTLLTTNKFKIPTTKTYFLGHFDRFVTQYANYVFKIF